MKMTIKKAGIDAGEYTATFKGCEDVETQYGAGARFIFEVDGTTISRITKPQATMANATGRIIAGMSGKSLSQGEEVDLDALVGKQFLITVETTNGTSTRVADRPAPRPV